MAKLSEVLESQADATEQKAAHFTANVVKLTQTYAQDEKAALTDTALAGLAEQAGSLAAAESGLAAAATELIAAAGDDTPIDAASLPPPPLTPQAAYEQTWQETKALLLLAQHITDKQPSFAKRLVNLSSQFDRYLQLAGELTSEQRNRLMQNLDSTTPLGKVPNIWFKALAEIHDLKEIPQKLRDLRYKLAGQEAQLGIATSSERGQRIERVIERISETLKVIDDAKLKQLDTAKAALEKAGDFPTSDNPSNRAVKRIDLELTSLQATTVRVWFNELKDFMRQQALPTTIQFDDTAQLYQPLLADKITELEKLDSVLENINDQVSLENFSVMLQKILAEAEQNFASISQAESTYTECFDDFSLLLAANGKATVAINTNEAKAHLKELENQLPAGTLVSIDEKQELKEQISLFHLTKSGHFTGIEQFKKYQQVKQNIEKNIKRKQEDLGIRKKHAREDIGNINKFLLVALPKVDENLDFTELLQNLKRASSLTGASAQLKAFEEKLADAQKLPRKFVEIQQAITNYKRQVVELHTDDITADKRAQLLQQLDQYSQSLQTHQKDQQVILDEQLTAGAVAIEQARAIFQTTLVNSINFLTAEINENEAKQQSLLRDFSNFAPELLLAISGDISQQFNLQQCAEKLTDFSALIDVRIRICEEHSDILEVYQKAGANQEEIERLQAQLDTQQKQLEQFKKLLFSDLQIVNHRRAKAVLTILNLAKAGLGDLQLAIKKTLANAVLLANCCVMLNDATIQNESWAQQIIQIAKNQYAALEHLAEQLNELDELEQLPSPVAAEITEVLKMFPNSKLTKEQLTVLPLAEKRKQLLVLISDYQKQLNPVVEGNVLTMAALPELVQQPEPTATRQAPVVTKIRDIDLNAIEPFLVRMSNTLTNPLTVGQLFQMSTGKLDLLKANLEQDYTTLHNLQQQLSTVNQDARTSRLLALTQKLSATIEQRQSLIKLCEQQRDCFIFTTAQLDFARLEETLQKAPEIYFVRNTTKNQQVGELWVFGPGIVAYVPNKSTPNSLPTELIKQYLHAEQIFCYGDTDALKPAISDLYSAVPNSEPQKIYINDQVVAATKSLLGRGIGFFGKSVPKSNFSIEAQSAGDKITPKMSRDKQ